MQCFIDVYIRYRQRVILYLYTVIFASIGISTGHAQTSVIPINNESAYPYKAMLNNHSLKQQAITPLLGADTPLNILVILSFSPLIPWSQEIQKGLISAVDAQHRPINLYIESMYESLAHSNSDRYHFDQSLRLKYSNITIDGVIADSSSAFEYLQALPENDPLFTAEIPIYYIHLTLDSTPNYAKTRTIENTLIQAINKTLSHLFSVRPNAKNLHILNYDAPLFQSHVRLIKQYIEDNDLPVGLQNYQFNELDEYVAAVAQIPPEDAIIYLPIFIANARVNLNAVQVLQAIAVQANAPIYSFSHNFVGQGAIGGYLMNSHLFGVDALNNIIAYNKTGKFIDNQNTGEWIFDYNQLAKLHINTPNYAEGVKIINTPSSIWEDYPLEIFLLICGALILLILLFWYKQYHLIQALKRSKSAEKTAENNANRIEALSNTKSKFMATMSHEIRTPINGMFGALGLLAKQNPTPLQQKYLNIAQYCSENLLNTVNDVLDFSKLDSGQFEFNPQPFSPIHLLQQVQQYASLISKDTDLAIELNINQLVDVPLLGDELRIQQILNNLINNSVKFTPMGSITIAAKINATYVPNHYQLEVSVTDTGIGISQEDLHKLFTPFIQINDTLERTKEGSGLGLSICKELIKLMEGKIFVTSTLGKGSCFSFYVILPQAMEGLSNEYTDLHPEPEFTINLSALHILLVEDNEINQEVMKAQLVQFGHHVCIAENGQIALDKMTSESPLFDVILMDIQMPVLNGYDATVAIRSGKAGEPYREIPIIALSAHANLHEQTEYDLTLFSAYLVKPTKEKALQKTLYDVLKKQ